MPGPGRVTGQCRRRDGQHAQIDDGIRLPVVSALIVVSVSLTIPGSAGSVPIRVVLSVEHSRQGVTLSSSSSAGLPPVMSSVAPGSRLLFTVTVPAMFGPH